MSGRHLLLLWGLGLSEFCALGVVASSCLLGLIKVAFTVTSQVVECALRSSVLSQPDLPPGAALRSSFVPGVR